MDKLNYSPQSSNSGTASREIWPTEAKIAADRLLGSFPHAKPHDPRMYIADLVEVFERYPPWVMSAVLVAKPWKNPAFLPSSAEVKHACEAEYRVASYAKEWEAKASHQTAMQIPDYRPTSAANKRYSYAEFECEFPGQRPIGRFERGKA